MHWSRGDAYAALGRYEEAIADYEVPWANDDVGEESEGARRSRLAGLFREARQPERAVRVLRELVEYCTFRFKSFPGGVRYYYERARALAELKEYSEAASDCRRALDLLAQTNGERRKPLTIKPYEADISRLLETILAESKCLAPPPQD
jgi:tetratricopeptide (TPR) repeat protein